MRVLVACVMMILGCILATDSVGAISLQIAPLSYEDTLAKGEKKIGYVDVSNPSGTPVTIRIKIQGFRQADNSGSIVFYDDDRISAGIRSDIDEVELGSREVLRVAFEIDGSKLPTGDVFAVISATTIPSSPSGVGQAVQVGTLLLLTNDTSPEHRAEIGALRASLFQVGEDIRMDFSVRNIGDQQKTTGFFPVISASIAPYSSKQVEGPLVFSGIERDVEYRQSGDFFGPVWLSVKTGNSEKGQWAIVVTGYWRWLAPLVCASMGVAVWLRRRKKTIFPRSPRSFRK